MIASHTPPAIHARPFGAAVPLPAAFLGDSTLACTYCGHDPQRYTENWGWDAVTAVGIPNGPTSGSYAYNFAIGGQTAAQELATQVPEYDRIPGQLSLVIIDAGSNEALEEPHQQTAAGAYYGVTGYFPAADYLSDAAAYHALVEAVATSPECPPATCTIVLKTVRSFGLTSNTWTTMDVDYVQPLVAMQMAEYRSLAAWHSALLFQTEAFPGWQTLPAYAEAFYDPANYQPDGIHPTPAGHAKWAGQLAPRLAALVAAPAARRWRR